MTVCNCIGPQNGAPRCPCRMKNVRIINGRYVVVTDLGPVSETVKKYNTPSYHEHFKNLMEGSHVP